MVRSSSAAWWNPVRIYDQCSLRLHPVERRTKIPVQALPCQHNHLPPAAILNHSWKTSANSNSGRVDLWSLFWPAASIIRLCFNCRVNDERRYTRLQKFHQSLLAYFPSHKYTLLSEDGSGFYRCTLSTSCFHTSMPSNAGFLLARIVYQRLVSEKNATTYREGTLELGNPESLSDSLVKR